MRIVTTFLLLAGGLTLSSGALAQYGSRGHYGGQNAGQPAAAVRAVPLPNFSSDARTIEITASANMPAPAPAPVAPQLRGTSSEPAIVPEQHAEGLRSVLTGVPARESFRPTGRVARGPHQSFEAPGIHVAATDGAETPAAVSFEELN